ncbi:MAG: hypothetical protein J5789_03420 [Oscillospiraceae bacterium]|nr:hypothetical protein [Oscillospiraceae bacterium]
MICRMRRVLSSRSGASRLTVVLLILVLVAVGIAAVPYVRQYLKDSEQSACEVAMESAYRKMTADYLLSLSSKSTPTSKDMRAAATYAMPSGDGLCPSNGTVYLIELDVDNEMPYEIVCGLHNRDDKRCTRLNASYVYTQIENAVFESGARGVPYPESVKFTLHNQEFTAVLVDDYTGLTRGTDKTNGLEGIVAYYSIVGHSDFGSNSGMQEGEVWYFSYADENHCATWSTTRGWEGDSYE